MQTVKLMIQKQNISEIPNKQRNQYNIKKNYLRACVGVFCIEIQHAQ